MPFALIVVLVIDQFRTDQLLRVQPKLNPGGIGLLVNKGLFYDDAHHTQFFNMTCPGHTAIATGAQPGLHGIMLNDDWDREQKKSIYCLADADHHWIDADLDNKKGLAIGTSPQRILTTTVGDELKAIGPQDSKVIALAIKDRSAIALAGHAADGAFFFAPLAQHWTSSDYYFPDKKLPAWLLQWNQKHHIDVSADFERSPESVTQTVDVALAAVEGEKLGFHKRSDLLLVSFSTHDYVGHITGDGSPELQKILTVEDQNIARLIRGIRKQLSKKNVLFVLTADHGAGIDKDLSHQLRLPSGQINSSHQSEELNECLAKNHLAIEQNIFMNIFLPKDVKDAQHARLQTKNCLEKQAGVLLALTREEILSNQVPETPWLKHLTSSYSPARGADVIGVLKPYWNSHDNHKVSHETPYDYDSWVPLAFWWTGVHHQLVHRRTDVIDLAPTLTRLLSARRPSGAQGQFLNEVLDKLIK